MVLKKTLVFCGKILGAGKRILTGESLFMTAFYNNLVGKRNGILCFTLSWKDFTH